MEWAFRLHREMTRDYGIRSNNHTLSSLVTVCAGERCGLAEALGAVREFRDHGGRPNPALVTSLVSLCGACGEPDAAVRVVAEHIGMEEQASPSVRRKASAAHRPRGIPQVWRPLDPYIRSALFSAVAVDGRRDLAMRALEWHHASIDSCEIGERVRGAERRRGDYVLDQGGGLRDRGAEGGNAEAAEKMRAAETVAHNALIYMCAQLGLIGEARQAYERMLLMGLETDTQTFNAMLMVCSSAVSKELSQGVGPSEGLAAHPALEEADKLLQEIKVKGLRPDEHTFGILIDLYASAQLPQKALLTFAAMTRAGVAPNLVHFTQLIDLYSKRGDKKSLEKAAKLYNMMRQRGIAPSEVTLSCLIDACCQTGDVDKAFRYYSEAAEAGLDPGDAVHNQLIRICTLNDRVDDALDLVKKMVRGKGDLEEVSLDSLVWALCHKHTERALRVTALMKTLKLNPSGRTLRRLAVACARDSYPREAYAVYRELLARDKLVGKQTGSALIRVLGKAGEVEQALEVFRALEREQCWADTRAILSLVAVCAVGGHLDPALEIVQRFKEQPDWDALADHNDDGEVSRLDVPLCNLFDALINRCCMAGRVKEALGLFQTWKDLSWEWERRGTAGDATGEPRLELSVATMAFLESRCRADKTLELQTSVVLSEMRRKGDRRRARHEARVKKPSHHFRASTHEEGH